MNKSYKSVWNESTGAWVAVSELANGRSKSKRAKTALSKAILTQIAVGGMSLTGMGAAMAADGGVTDGTGATVNVANGIAFGTDATADLDRGANADKDGGVAIGDSAYTAGSGVAIGQSAQAGSDSLAFGAGATASLGGTAVGANSRAFNNNAVALGSGASAGADGSLALGAGSSVTGLSSVALGQNSVADRDNTVSVGTSTAKRQITNVADGTQNSDAVTLNQLKAAGIIVDTSGVATNAFVAYDSTAKSAITLGGGTAGTKITNVAAGALTATSTDAVNGSQLLSAMSSASNKYFVANDAASGAIASTASGIGSIAIGANAKSSTTGGANASIAIGSDALTTVQAATAIGPGATVSAANSVAIGTASVANRANTVSVGTASANRQIVNVAAGTSATDAVNLGQLAAAGLNVDTSGVVTNVFVAYDSTAKTGVTLGGGSAGTQIHNLAAGSTTTDAVNVGQLTAAGLSIGTSGTVTNSFVAYDTSVKDLITLKGASGTKITNLTAGTVSANSKDAVNGTQLYPSVRSSLNAGLRT